MDDTYIILYFVVHAMHVPMCVPPEYGDCILHFPTQMHPLNVRWDIDDDVLFEMYFRVEIYLLCSVSLRVDLPTVWHGLGR